MIRKAIREKGMALGRVVFTSREHVIALEPRGKGLLGITLRYPYEVRKQSEYFDDIPDEKIPKDLLELTSHIVRTKAGHFHRNSLKDLRVWSEDRGAATALAREGDQPHGRATA